MWQNTKLETLSSSWPVQRLSTILVILTSLGFLGVSVYTITGNQTHLQKQKIESPSASLPEIKTVTALGKLQPNEEIIKVSAASNLEGSLVKQVLVKEGDKVTAGQVIAIMDSQDQREASFKEAQRQVEVAKAQLAQVKAGAKQGEILARQAIVSRLEAELKGYVITQQAEIARLKTQLSGESAIQQATVSRLRTELQGQQQSLAATVKRTAAEKGNATAELLRYEMLYKQGAISSQEVDKKRLIAETANEQLIESQANQARIIASLQQQIAEATAKQDTTLASLQKQIQEAQAEQDKTIATLQQQALEAKADLAQVKEVRPTDVAKVQAEVEASQATVEKVKKQLEQAYIRAPKTGRILKINARPGETVSNQGIVDLGQTDQMYAVVEVYQSDINKVRPGQKVKVVGDSLPGELQGIVDRVGWQVQRQDIVNSDPASNLDSRVVEVYVRLDEASSQQVDKLTNLQVKAVISL